MKKILIYRNSSLGDFIVSLPAINLIKKKNPDSIIYYASQIRNIAGHVKPHEIPIKKKLIDRFIYFKYKKLSFLNFLYKVLKLRFDKIYYLNGIISKKKLFRDYLIYTIIGIKKKYGFKKIKYNYTKFNETFYLCQRVKSNLSSKDISIKDYLKKERKKLNYKYISISFGGKHDLKKWRLENWKTLVLWILKIKPKIKIIIVGSKNEHSHSKYLKNLKPKSIINLCGKTNIKKLINIIGNSEYHISHDDGTMHIASTFYKKSFAIFGKSTGEKGKWFPKNPNLKIFFKDNVNDISISSVKKKIFNDIKKIKFN